MARGKDSPTAARARKREATHVALVRAAHELAPRADRDPLDPAHVAAEAGVSRPLFYAHFKTRGDFVDALLASIHEERPNPARAEPPPSNAREAVVGFFERLAEPLDRHAALARRIIPASHLPGPVADARARRRERAIARIAALFPASTPEREARAAFLMDAFLGIQLAWSKTTSASLAERVRKDLSLAVRGVLETPS